MHRHSNGDPLSTIHRAARAQVKNHVARQITQNFPIIHIGKCYTDRRSSFSPINIESLSLKCQKVFTPQVSHIDRCCPTIISICFKVSNISVVSCISKCRPFAAVSLRHKSQLFGEKLPPCDALSSNCKHLWAFESFPKFRVLFQKIKWTICYRWSSEKMILAQMSLVPFAWRISSSMLTLNNCRARWISLFSTKNIIFLKWIKNQPAFDIHID